MCGAQKNDCELSDDEDSFTEQDMDDRTDLFDDNESSKDGHETFLTDGTEVLPSVGSALHVIGACTPCGFVFKPRGCKAGSQCHFCHHFHEAPQTKKERAFRPCKTKRDQYRKLMHRLLEEVEANPKAFDVETQKLSPSLSQMIPMSISSNLDLMKKLKRRVQERAMMCSVKPSPPPSDTLPEAWWQPLQDVLKDSHNGEIHKVGPWTVTMLSF